MAKYLNVTYNRDDDEEGVFVLSQVKNPAVGGKNLLLNKEEPPKLRVKLAEEGDKMIIYCVALSPHVDIWRNAASLNSDEGAYLKFSAETIEDIANDFLTKGLLLGGTLDHSINTDDFKVIQSWTVTDSTNDKAIALGIEDIEGGEWIVGMQVTNIDLWEQFKAGDFTGISIEGNFGLELIELSLGLDCAFDLTDEEIRQAAQYMADNFNK